MDQELDDTFYNCADAHINLSNRQVKDVDFGKVSASMMYATARFNCWVRARGYESGEQMAGARKEIIEYFKEQYRLMLEENFDDHVQNFERYSLSWKQA
jgi:Protein of unknown function (DUF3144)